VVHTNAPRVACQITVKCGVKTILSVVLVKVEVALIFFDTTLLG